jgi:hypothetical protein
MKSIQDYLPEHTDRKPIQPWITPEVYMKVNEIRKSLGKTWSEIIQACLEHLIDEVREGTKKKILKELNKIEKYKKK